MSPIGKALVVLGLALCFAGCQDQPRVVTDLKAEEAKQRETGNQQGAGRPIPTDGIDN
jgi:hypothetical protein